MESAQQHGRASMGPRSEERGEDCMELMRGFPDKASMGPRSEERGEKPSSISPTASSALQWGRAPRSAESAIRVTCSSR